MLRQPVRTPPLLASRRRRQLLGEAPTQLLVSRQPPEEDLKLEVYQYIRDFFSANASCVPRSLRGKSRECSGAGGGNSCRGMGEPYCQPAPAWVPGKAMESVYPWNTYKSPHGKEPPGSWGKCAFVATGEQVRRRALGGSRRRFPAVCVKHESASPV